MSGLGPRSDGAEDRILDRDPALGKGGVVGDIVKDTGVTSGFTMRGCSQALRTMLS